MIPVSPATSFAPKPVLTVVVSATALPSASTIEICDVPCSSMWSSGPVWLFQGSMSEMRFFSRASEIRAETSTGVASGSPMKRKRSSMAPRISSAIVCNDSAEPHSPCLPMSS